MGSFSWLFGRTARRILPKAIVDPLPEVMSHVEGVRLSVERGDGVLLHHKKQSPDEEARPATEDTYYLVTLTITGTNPEYKNARTSEIKYTKSLGTSSGMNGGVFFCNSQENYVRFEVKEATGPEAHSLELHATRRNAEGIEHSEMCSMSGWEGTSYRRPQRRGFMM